VVVLLAFGTMQAQVAEMRTATPTAASPFRVLGNGSRLVRKTDHLNTRS
jgi:hypothetical protein